MDYILPFIPEKIKNIPVHMDYDGQRKAEKLFQIIILLFAVIGFVIGYVTQHFSHTVYTLFAGFCVSCLLTLPPWPYYRQKPIKWLSVVEDSSNTSNASASSATPKDKKKKK